LRLGKEGAQLKSKANIAKSYRGANLEYGIGTKAEALLGLDASFKLAQSYEVIIGQLFEMMIGNRVEVGVGTKWDSKQIHLECIRGGHDALFRA
jgi:hypothetical protein